MQNKKLPDRSIEDGTRARRGLTHVLPQVYAPRARAGARGFTLFTALVGILLVVLGVLLAQSMSSTERSTAEIIAENRIDQEMLDAATLAQADSLQEFNFGLRSAMEKYFSHSDHDNYYELESSQWNSNIDEIAADFEDKHFGEDLEQISDFAANELASTLPGVKRTPDFLIRIPEFESAEFKEKLKTALQPVSGGKIIEAIDCTDKDNCPRGTFYINLDFASLSDQDYESLPKIEVIKKSTCRLASGQNDVSDDVSLDKCVKKIKIPIVPRGKVRILVPLRVFKAIASAQEIASIVFDDSTNRRLETVKLGVCDSKDIILRCCPPLQKECYETTSNWYSCAARKKVEIPISSLHNQGASMDKVCIEHEADLEQKEEHTVDLEDVGGTYDPYELSSAKRAMEEYTFKEILVPNANTSDRIKDFVSSNELSLQEFELENKFKETNQSQSVFFRPRLDARAFDSRSLGFDSDDDGADDFSTCSKILKIDAGLVFEEKNPIYKLDTTEGFSFQVRLVKNDIREFDEITGHSDYEEVMFCPSNENAPSCTGYSDPPYCSYARDA